MKSRNQRGYGRITAATAEGTRGGDGHLNIRITERFRQEGNPPIPGRLAQPLDRGSADTRVGMGQRVPQRDRTSGGVHQQLVRAVCATNAALLAPSRFVPMAASQWLFPARSPQVHPGDTSR